MSECREDGDIGGEPGARSARGPETRTPGAPDAELPRRMVVDGDPRRGEHVLTGDESGATVPITLEQAKAAKARALEAFRKVGDVVGVGITRLHGQYAVKVNLRESPGPGVTVPTAIDGVPVRVEVTGTIKGL